ncbi:MAG: carbonic anhydrase [Bacteroidetes bacterium]|nr:carbonic anhydrase [Bacteroidota bacterium]
MLHEKIYKKIFDNNKIWVEDKLNADKDFFVKLASDQSPNFLYIGCSDSRVPANEIMGLEPGEVFVHRNIANQVVNIDMNVHSIVQYAVQYLDVKHIIVCGHYGCGGVKAAMANQDFGSLNGWLSNIRDVMRIHQDELDAIKDDDEKFRRLVELNVQEQCINLIKTVFIQKSYNKNGYPIVNGWVYDLRNGLLQDLRVDFETILDKIRSIYSLNQ